MIYAKFFVDDGKYLVGYGPSLVEVIVTEIEAIS